MFDFKTRVLVVDDMLTMRKLVSKICRELGFTDIVEASDGAKAWELVSDSASTIGLVISDWNMPNSTGLDLLKRIRGSQKHAKLPFIMVTAEAEIQQISEALQSGVTDYVVKPFTADVLKQKLENAHKKVSK